MIVTSEHKAAKKNRSFNKTHSGRCFNQWFGRFKWPLIALLWVVAIALGCVGFSKYYSTIGGTQNTLDFFYNTLQLFVLESSSINGVIGPELQVARFLAPALSVTTAALALFAILSDRIQMLLLRFYKDHVVICGLGRKGQLLCERFIDLGQRVVVIESDENNDMLEACKEMGAALLIGSATEDGLLNKAQIQKARMLFAVCGDDGTNAEIAVRTRDLVSTRKGKALSCLVHIVDPQLNNLLREREIGLGKLDAFRLEFFNIAESGAKILIERFPPFDISNEASTSIPHIVVVGIGHFGEAVVVNVARKWRDLGASQDKKICITLVDREAVNRKESLLLRFPQLQSVCDLLPEQVDIESPNFERGEFLFDADGSCILTMIYVCLDDDSRALAAALKLQKHAITLGIPVVVRMAQETGLATLLRGERIGTEQPMAVHAFGLLDHTCTPDLIHGCTYEMLSMAFHEDYVQKQSGKELTVNENPSLLPWDELPENLRESNRKEAEHIRVKLEAIGCGVITSTDWGIKEFVFLPEEIELMAGMEHERFVQERLQDGWEYGPVKDNARKISPTLVPWDGLSEEEKQKDRDAVEVLPSLLAKVGLEIYRYYETA